MQIGMPTRWVLMSSGFGMELSGRSMYQTLE
jgi:hypothetical protein